MARKSDIQYIQYYTDGSAARQIAPKAPQRKKKSRPQQEKKLVLRVDPLAHSGILIASVMLILMVVGLFRLHAVREEVAQMQSYVDCLTAENALMQLEYESSYDLEAVERTALSMGMVPVEEVEHVSIRVQPPHQEAEPTAWEKFTAFLTGLFA